MTLKGFVNKHRLPLVISSNGVKTYSLPTVYVDREPLEALLGKDNVVEVEIEIVATKVHV